MKPIGWEPSPDSEDRPTESKMGPVDNSATRVLHEKSMRLLTRSLNDLRKPESSDVVFKCQDQQLHAHKLVLQATSPYFQTLLGNNKSSLNGKFVIELTDVDPESMENILEFIYLGTVEKVKTSAQILKILDAALTMELDELVQYCYNTLKEMSTIQPETVHEEVKQCVHSDPIVGEAKFSGSKTDVHSKLFQREVDSTTLPTPMSVKSELEKDVVTYSVVVDQVESSLSYLSSDSASVSLSSSDSTSESSTSSDGTGDSSRTTDTELTNNSKDNLRQKTWLNVTGEPSNSVDDASLKNGLNPADNFPSNSKEDLSPSLKKSAHETLPQESWDLSDQIVSVVQNYDYLNAMRSITSLSQLVVDDAKNWFQEARQGRVNMVRVAVAFYLCLLLSIACCLGLGFVGHHTTPSNELSTDLLACVNHEPEMQHKCIKSLLHSYPSVDSSNVRVRKMPGNGLMHFALCENEHPEDTEYPRYMWKLTYYSDYRKVRAPRSGFCQSWLGRIFCPRKNNVVVDGYEFQLE